MDGITELKKRFRNTGYIYMKSGKKGGAIYFHTRDGKSYSTKTTDVLQANEVISDWIKNGFPLSKAAVKKNKEASIPLTTYLAEFWEKEEKNLHVTKYYCATNNDFIKRFYVPFFEEAKLEEIDNDRMNSFYEFVKSHISKKTGKPLTFDSVNGIMSASLLPLKNAGKKTKIDWSDMVSVKRSDFAKKDKRLGILTDDEVSALLASEWSNPKNRLAFLLTINLGLRVGELRALRIGCITNTLIRINRAYNDIDGLKGTKTERKDKDGNRNLPIDAYIYNEIQQYTNQLPIFMRQPECFLFTKINDGSSPVDISTFRNAFYRQLKKCGIERERINPVTGKLEYICFYSLRHNAATRLMRRGIDVNKVSRFMGHSPLMTMHYSAHLTDDDAEILRNALSEAGVQTLKADESTVLSFPAKQVG